tara:strand:+ start:13648 stop:14286 length:639 start_codon:yes stop_codon:yes gene_type:complete
LKYKEKIDLDLSCLDSSFLVGSDEVGRGCIAGPVVVASLILSKEFYKNFESILSQYPILSKVDDSKKTSEKNRKLIMEAFAQLRKDKVLNFLIGQASVDYINKNGLSNSLRKAYLDSIYFKEKEITFLVDGNEEFIENSKTIVKGDAKSFVIGGASIIAKEYRDNLMISLSKDFDYGFEKHKGYATKLHKEKLKENGLSVFHRTAACKTFLS